MKTLFPLMVALFLPFFADSGLSFDFGNETNKCQNWLVISDNVMGGRTESSINYTANTLYFSGTISLKNYGGFSSIRTPFDTYNLSRFKGLKIKYKSVSQTFAFTLENSRNWTRPNYKEVFTSKDNTWQTATIYFKDFKEYQIGEPTGYQLNVENLKDIVRLGIITTEKTEGPFSLEIDYITFF